jgi:glutamyl-tRNA synthetase
MKKELADKLLHSNLTIEEIENKYIPRTGNPTVTRFAPSPTGFMHIGGVWTSLLSERLAHSSGGIFYLRIEDTDQKRKVQEATDIIVNTLKYLGIEYDEGVMKGGNYGSYIQSERVDIYKAYIKKLLIEGKAYPSFMSADELSKMREEQEKMKLRTGLYGHWAKERNLTDEQIESYINQEKRFVINFKATGDVKNRIAVSDLVKGKRMLPENDIDIVILKADGLPTYHFAHVIDDHLMGTTIVNRTDEWFISTPLHLQLFQAMGWQPPQYLQPAPLQKMDGNAKRKLSKRKDIEADFRYFMEQGYPKEAIVDYIMNLLNSNFEEWRKQNPKANYKDFPFDYKKINESGALLDFPKLDNVTKNFIASLTAEEIYDRLFEWSNDYDKKLHEKMRNEKEKFIKIFNIERIGNTKIRKDYGKLSDMWINIDFFFDFKLQKNLNNEIINDYIKTYNETWSKEEWFNNIKEKAKKFGYAINNKEFNENEHKGDISQFVNIFRLLITGKTFSPDLYSIMQILGKDEVIRRLMGC